MRLVFAGTPAPAVPSLQALLDSRHEVVGVITRPDARSGRGRRGEQFSPVKELALAAGVPVLQPRSLRDDGTLAQLREQQPPPSLSNGVVNGMVSQNGPNPHGPPPGMFDHVNGIPPSTSSTLYAAPPPPPQQQQQQQQQASTSQLPPPPAAPSSRHRHSHGPTCEEQAGRPRAH